MFWDLVNSHDYSFQLVRDYYYRKGFRVVINVGERGSRARPQAEFVVGLFILCNLILYHYLYTMHLYIINIPE